MSQENGHEAKPNSARENQYQLRGSGSATDLMAKRTISEHAAFLMPYLRPGMRLVDCGCGPGTMTIGFAEFLKPAEVVGLDISGDQIAVAERLAADQGVSNVRFEQGTIYQLSFPDQSFDVAFVHAILEHLQKPEAALAEVYRVLKPGGLIGVRTPDWDGILTWPFNPLLERTFEVAKALFARGGGNQCRGKQLRALLHQTGFVQIRATASYESYGTPEAVKAWQETITGIWEDPGMIERAIGFELVDRETLSQLNAAWRAWSTDPEAFHARPWCEAVGWVPAA